jgi:hypothetical protein
MVWKHMESYIGVQGPRTKVEHWLHTRFLGRKSDPRNVSEVHRTQFQCRTGIHTPWWSSCWGQSKAVV